LLLLGTCEVILEVVEVGVLFRLLLILVEFIQVSCDISELGCRGRSRLQFQICSFRSLQEVADQGVSFRVFALVDVMEQVFNRELRLYSMVSKQAEIPLAFVVLDELCIEDGG